MSCISFGEERKEDASAQEILGTPVDIRDKLKGIWD
jgi:hypothetical protein